jgi:hypothetical protein
MAAKWEAFMEDGDRYNLQYRTAGDGNVRPEHAALQGVTLPPSDQFWADFYPPNGWNCRCTVVQVRKSKFPTTDHNEAMERGNEALQRDTKGIFRFNPGIEQKSVPDYNPYTIRRCRDCDIAKGKQSLAKCFIPDNELCDACREVHTLANKKDNADLSEQLKQALNASGKARISSLRDVVALRRFDRVENHVGVISAISNADPDYERLLACADKAVNHGYNVAMLPKLTGIRTPDFILYNNKFIATYDVKTITGQNSVSNRLQESIGQTNRVILNMATTYNPRNLAKDIRCYFESNKDAVEVMIFKGNKLLSIKRQLITKDFEHNFRKEYGRNK